MRKPALYFTFAACLIGLSGCSTSPEPLSIAPHTMADEFQEMSAGILESGGLAAVGIGESKSLALALNQAKTDGRIKLADLLEAKTNGLPESLADQIQGLVAKELQHETTNGTTTAYALMELNPNVFNQENKTVSEE